MKLKHTFRCLLLALVSLPTLVRAQGTTFTYQGRLTEAGNPVSGTYDMQFKLYDLPGVGTGTQQGATLANNSVQVANGVFSVTLNFGASVFDGTPRFIEVSERPGGSANPYIIMDPRQPVSPAPYAIYAGSAGNVGNGSVTASQLNTGGVLPAAGQFLSYDGAKFSWSDPGVAAGNLWSLNGLNSYYNAGNVGIGTMAPLTSLEVNGIVRSTRIGEPAQYVQLDGGDPFSIRLTAQSIVSAEKALVIQNLSGETTPGANNSIQFAVGTTAAPSTKMTITKDGNVLMNPKGGGTIQFGTPNFETGMTIDGANRADLRFDGSIFKMLVGPGGSIPPSGNGIAINSSGNVGIGTTTPVAKLDVENSQPGKSAVYGTETGTSGVGVYGEATSPSGAGVFARNLNGIAITADGNATQGRSAGGFVKAMVLMHYDGSGSSAIPSFVRGYNGVTGAATGQCGFSYDHYVEPLFGILHTTIDFGFTVNDRFISLTAVSGDVPQGVSVFGFPNAHTIDVRNDGDFYIIVY